MDIPQSSVNVPAVIDSNSTIIFLDDFHLRHAHIQEAPIILLTPLYLRSFHFSMRCLEPHLNNIRVCIPFPFPLQYLAECGWVGRTSPSLPVLKEIVLFPAPCLLTKTACASELPRITSIKYLVHTIVPNISNTRPLPITDYSALSFLPLQFSTPLSPCFEGARANVLISPIVYAKIMFANLAKIGIP